MDAIFQYLGRVLTYSSRERAIPFFIDSERPRDPRFHVDYRGKTYYVSESSMPCKEQDPSRGRFIGRDCPYVVDGPVAERDRGDETLFVLSVLNQLLNLYKSASDIPVTPAVQAVP